MFLSRKHEGNMAAVVDASVVTFLLESSAFIQFVSSRNTLFAQTISLLNCKIHAHQLFAVYFKLTSEHIEQITIGQSRVITCPWRAAVTF